MVLVARADAVVDRVAHEQPAAGLAAALPVATRTISDGEQLAALEVAAAAASCRHHLVAEQLGERRRPRASSSRGVPDSTIRPSHEHDGAVGELDGREPLRRDEHRAARERGAEALHEPPLGQRVDGRQRVVEHDDARAA